MYQPPCHDKAVGHIAVITGEALDRGDQEGPLDQFVAVPKGWTIPIIYVDRLPCGAAVFYFDIVKETK